MGHAATDNLDPRIRRTRQALQQALEKLLQTKEFDRISVQEIAEAAELNRATFYDHYADRHALLMALVGGRFCGLLTERGVNFNFSCDGALRATVLATYDYLAAQRRLEPHMEQAIVAVVRRILLEGFEKEPPRLGAPTPMVAAAAAGALYAAVKEWQQTPGHGQPEELAATVAMLLMPMLRPVYDAGAGVPGA